MTVPLSVIEDDSYHTMAYAQSLPYADQLGPETTDMLQDIVDHFLLCVQVGDFAPGALTWLRRLSSYLDLKHALPRTTRAQLALTLYNLAVTPGMDYPLVEAWALICIRLIKQVHEL
ncbi:hypothetical protein DM01DRAFT_330262 [Hesseltinella vesiculosa]|uniref:Uncharacterized protein n=1 Tax=Hesseltinella vesiculosa TaxID=101127 RepID=A0A1X2GKU8_9FUNG|nr:hypothetical protein DM01DRAFT_330262 [Hesseltinella vesiculosa]